MSDIQEDRRPFVRWLASRVTQTEFLQLRSTMDMMERYLKDEGRSADIIYRAARKFNGNALAKYQTQFQNDSYFRYLHGNRTEDVQTIFAYLIEFSLWHRKKSDAELMASMSTSPVASVKAPPTENATHVDMSTSEPEDRKEPPVEMQPVASETTTSEPPNPDVSPISTAKRILQHSFPRGIRLQSKIDRKRFRAAWEKEQKTALPWNDASLQQNLERLMIPCGPLYYLPETLMDEETKQHIREYIEDCFAQGASAIYLDAIYKKFEDDLQRTRITNVEMLRMYLGSIAGYNFYLFDKYISQKRYASPKPKEDVRRYLVEQNMPVPMDRMMQDLSFLDETSLRRVLAGPNETEFIRNAQGEYFHASIVCFSAEELRELRQMIQASLDDRSFLTGHDLMQLVETRLPDILERYPYLTEMGLRDRVAYDLNGMFSFRGSLISERGATLSVKDVFARFASKHDHFTMADLDALKEDLAAQIDFPSVYQHALRISQDEFVSKRLAHFDIEATDDVLEHLCVGEELPLCDITFWGSFPDAGYPWNSFLLQHYVADFSRRFRLMCNGYTVDTPTGIIVRQASQVQDFDDALTELLARSEIVLEEKGALRYLQSKGAIARKKYSRIAYVVERAKNERGKKG